MKLQLQRFFYVLIPVFSLVSCVSADKYNSKLSKPISVEKLQKDINYTQHKLHKLYPNLYQYSTKEKLDYKFDSIRKVVIMPMTSKEFYFVIAPVISSVRQGHMTMTPVIQRFSKKETLRLKKSGDGPMSQLTYEWENDKLYVIKNKSKKKNVLLGAELLSVNGITPQEIFKKYRNTLTSDGFNLTYIPKGFTKRYVNYMTNEIGVNDSLLFVFKQKDSIFSTIISRNKPKKLAEIANAKDSRKSVSKIPLDKVKIKAERKFKRIYGYNSLTKEYAKNLKFVPEDKSVAILKLKNFTEGIYVKAYDAIFDSIKRHDIKNLIIDLRDNPGGRIADAVNLYSHLTQTNFKMLQPAIVTSKTSLWKLGLFRNIPKLSYPLAAVFYPFYMGFSTLRTTKNSNGNYQYKLVGSRTTKFAAINYDGKIYVLINGGSFSAACIVSSSLKARPNVVFVGEETGGAFNGTVAGIMPVVKLPNSKILLRLGLMDIKTIHQTEIIGRGIFPEVEIPLTVQDKITNKDPQMDWIINDIKVKEQNK